MNENLSNISEENFEINRKEKIAGLFLALKSFKRIDLRFGAQLGEINKNDHKAIDSNSL
ncbi:MAG: hypothetical protein IT395_04615 [Candidatus Omnitrophica bacterium]|nr:hypothetical protein [Candidatus Omnitrophota bacterium]